jgi:fatty acid desaturase
MIRATTDSAHPIPNRLNAAIVVFQIAAVGACFAMAARAQTGWAVAGTAILFALLMNSVYSIIHEAEHGMLFSNHRANEWAGVLMAMLFPAPFHLIRQGHLGHHMRNRSDDEAFDLYFEDDHRIWRVLVFYGILTGMYYFVVVLSNLVFLVAPFAADKRYWQFDRPSIAFVDSLNPRYRIWIQLEALATIVLHVGIVCTLGIPVVHYLIMYSAFGLTWSSMQYVHHYGTERHITRGARNLWIFEPIDRIWLNHNWHLAHHEHPTIPWPHLPRLGQEESADKPRGFLLTAYLRMWRGPSRTSESVENKFAGKVIK